MARHSEEGNVRRSRDWIAVKISFADLFSFSERTEIVISLSSLLASGIRLAIDADVLFLDLMFRVGIGSEISEISCEDQHRQVVTTTNTLMR